MPEAVLLAAILVAAPFAPGAMTPDEVRAEVTTRTVAAIEKLSPEAHHDHGHDVSAGQSKIVCVAELMGYEPKEAARTSDVKTAYTYFLCAAGAPGQPYAQSAHISGPAAIDLRNDPAVVHVPEAGANYLTRMRAIIPAEYQQWAINGFRDRAIPAALVKKYEAAIGSTTAP